MEQSVAFAAVGRTRGFVGVGFSPSGFMQGSIAAVCRNLAPTPICEERALNGYTASQIILDPQRPHISAGRITIEGAFMVAEVRTARYACVMRTVHVEREPPERQVQLLARRQHKHGLLLFAKHSDRVPWHVLLR